MNETDPTSSTNIRPPESTLRARLAAGAAVFGGALVVRLVYAAQASGCPLFQYPTIDAGVYYLLARDFWQGHWLYPLGEPYWQPPFYSAVLGLWMKIGGDSVSAAKYAQFVLGSFNCSLVFALGSRLFGRRAGIIAGFVAALYAPIIYFDGELLTPTLQICLNLCAILILLSAVERASTGPLAAAGLVMGLSIITRPDVALFVACSAVWVYASLRGRVGGGRAIVAGAVLLGCAALPVVPTAVRNRVVGKDSVLISYNGGVNFFIGNNPNSEQTLALRPGSEWDDLVSQPLRRDPGATPSEQSGYFYSKSFSYIRSQPINWLKLLVKKALTYVTAIEGRRNHDMYFMRGYSSLFSAMLFRVGPFAFPLGAVLPLAVLGAIRRPRGAGTALLLVYAAAMFAATTMFFVVARYRVTTAPVFIVFAAYGVSELWRMVKTRDFALGALVSAVIAFLVCNTNLPGVDNNRRLIDADNHYFVAGILDGDGKKLEAVPEYERAIGLNPRFYMSRLNYGRMLCELGRWKQAIEQLEAARRLNRSAELDWLLGDAYARNDQDSRALKCYESAARTDPTYIEGLANVGQDAYINGDHAFAAQALGVVIVLRPDYAQARYALGLAFMKLNRLDESIGQLRTACELDPGSAQPWFALGVAYERVGQQARAKAAFDRAVSLDPSGEMARKLHRNKS